MSNSKLSALCDYIVEAGWLAAAITAPLFFSIGYTTMMDADKVALLRSIAGIMTAAWFIKWIENRRTSPALRQTASHSPLVLPTLLLVGTYLLATLTSIAPRIALFGSYQRAQGTYTLISFIVIFAMVLQGLCTRQQLDRLIAAIILTSFPMALYAIFQKYGLDPLTWVQNFDGRAGSTTGNPIFLSAYLIIVLMLTLGRVVEHVYAAIAKPGKPFDAIVLSITYALVALVQIFGIIVTDSRGPLLGGFAGIVLFVVLLATMRRQWKAVVGVLGFAGVGIVFLSVLNLPSTPLAALRALPAFDRLGNLANATGEFRLFTWDNAARLALPHTPVQFPDGAPDALNAIRPLVGYGPDTMSLVYGQVSPASPYAHQAETDRSHNATWDAWVTTGLIGVGAYQLLFLFLFLYGFRGLDLVRTNLDRNWFVGLWVGLGVGGALGAIAVGQPGLVGLALPAGNISALGVYLVLFARHANTQPETGRYRADRILLAALLAGLFAHYVESQFGIDVPPTQTIFWIFAGVLGVLTSQRLQAATQSVHQFDLRAELGSATSYALIGTVILSTLAYEFVTYAKGLSNPLSVLWHGLTFDPAHNTTSYAILGLALSTWFIATVLVFFETARSRASVPTVKIKLPPPRRQVAKEKQSSRAPVILLAGLPLALSMLFGLALSAQVGALPYVPALVTHLENALAVARQMIGIIDSYALALFVLILLMGIALFWESRSPTMRWAASAAGPLALIPVAVATLLWTNVVDLNPMRADATYRLGQFFDDQADYSSAIALYKQAIRLAPANDVYYMSLGGAYQQQSSQANVTAASQFNASTAPQEILDENDQRVAGLNRLDLLYAAETMLLHARELNPLYLDHTLNLARFYQPELPVDTPTTVHLRDMANHYYVEAQRLEPNSVLVWNERALFDLRFENDSNAALQKLDESIARDAQWDQTYLDLGQVYAIRHDDNQAIVAYQKALALNPKSTEAQSKLAFLYYQQGQDEAAIQAYLKYLDLAPGAQNAWEAHKNLALIYEQTGDLASAARQAQLAAQLAPKDMAAQVSDWAKQLQSSN
jgi:tetratricopeptide (TPR) repeat protein